MFNFFLNLCFIVTKFCVLACLNVYLNAYKIFILTVALWNVFPHQKFCVMYLNVAGFQMKA